jgi:hypothetical protein
VRLAQQAYRHRKEALVIFLKTENEELKESLTNTKVAFDVLLGLILKDFSHLSSLEIAHCASKSSKVDSIPRYRQKEVIKL